MLNRTIALKVLPDFRPEYIPGWKWQQLSSGNWFAVDRGVATDQYCTTVNLYGRESAINAVITEIESNRTTFVASQNVLTLSEFSSTEKIFGADIDYSGYISVIVDETTQWRRKQNTLKGWSLSLRMIALSPPISSVAPALPPLKLISVGVDADSDRTIKKNLTYTNDMSANDYNADYGTFAGVFTFSDIDMARMRRFYATNRTAISTIPKIYGITYPFGRRSAANPTNFNCVITELADEKLLGVGRWTCKLTIAEELYGL